MKSVFRVILGLVGRPAGPTCISIRSPALWSRNNKLSVLSSRLGLKTPQGITVDAQGGRLFILDAAVPRIVGITPDGRISQMPLGRLGGGRLRGIAFNPNNGHLYVLSPAKRELYELTDTGQLVSTRDLTPTGLTDPQGMVFARSGNSTDDPAGMSLYVADSDPTPVGSPPDQLGAAGATVEGSTEKQGLGRIIEFTRGWRRFRSERSPS